MKIRPINFQTLFLDFRREITEKGLKMLLTLATLELFVHKLCASYNLTQLDKF